MHDFELNNRLKTVISGISETILSVKINSLYIQLKYQNIPIFNLFLNQKLVRNKLEISITGCFLNHNSIISVLST